nr:B3 domain-containing protein At5g24050-like [Ipomoea batatas]
MKLKGSAEGNCLKRVRMIGKKSTKPRTTGGNPSLPPKLHSRDQSALELNSFLPPKLYSHHQSTLELNPSLPLKLHSNDQKRSKKEGAAENKRKLGRGGGGAINIQEPLPPGLAEKLNNLIPHLPNLPNNQEALNAKLAIEKELKETDVSNHHNRMSIPSKHIQQKFLNREEELKLCERNEKNVGSIDVPLITPTMEIVTASLRRWPMNKQSGPPSISYVLTTHHSFLKILYTEFDYNQTMVSLKDIEHNTLPAQLTFLSEIKIEKVAKESICLEKLRRLRKVTTKPRTTRVSESYPSPNGKRKRSKNEGAAENNKRKRGNNIQTQEPPPELPEKIKNLISHLPETREVSRAKLVIQKPLTVTDVSNHHNRMSIPAKHIRETFLTEEEELKLCMRDEKNVESMDVPLITPAMEMANVSLRRWPMNKQSGPPSISYVLTTTWNKIKEQNRLRSGMNVQLWAIRIDGVLCFALTLKPKK